MKIRKFIQGNLSEIPCGKSYTYHIENGLKDKPCPPDQMNYSTKGKKGLSQRSWYSLMEDQLGTTDNLILKLFEAGRHAHTYIGCADTVRSAAYQYAVKKGACQNTRKYSKPVKGLSFTVEAA
mgnify:FL=1